MNKDEFVKIVDSRLKLVRTEYGFTQEKMAGILGISKKTLVEIEKGRRSLGWTGAVCCSTIFEKSNTLQNDFGGFPEDLIAAIAFSENTPVYPKTMGGHVWWREIRNEDGFRIQQNYISGHYRLLDPDDCRVIASFDIEEIENTLAQLLRSDNISE